MTNPPPVAPVVREYIEIGAGYVVATKGDGSTYRIHAPDDAERVIVLPEFYHSFYTQMAKAIAAERAVASGELERLRAALKAHEVQWNRLQDAISGMEKTMEAHGIDHFKWQPMTFDETLKGDAP